MSMLPSRNPPILSRPMSSLLVLLGFSAFKYKFPRGVQKLQTAKLFFLFFCRFSYWCCIGVFVARAVLRFRQKLRVWAVRPPPRRGGSRRGAARNRERPNAKIRAGAGRRGRAARPNARPTWNKNCQLEEPPNGWKISPAPRGVERNECARSERANGGRLARREHSGAENAHEWSGTPRAAMLRGCEATA